MANSPSNQPIRSISLPSRPHPLVPQIDEYLYVLKSSDVASTSVTQLSSLAHKLSNLRDLYDCLDDLIVLPQNQSKLVQSYNAKCIDSLLDGSLRLLDFCGIAKDVLSQMKEHVQEIQSSLRRKSNGEFSIGSEILGYMSMRKKTKMVIKKSLKDVKGMVKCFALHGERKNNGNVPMVDVLKEVEAVTAEIFESLLEVISGARGKSLKRSASLSFVMCKLVMSHNVGHDKEEALSLNEIEVVDSTLSSLVIAQKKRSCINVTQAENLRSQMVKLDSSIQDLDEVLEGLFRCLVKTRATLLNVLSN